MALGEGHQPLDVDLQEGGQGGDVPPGGQLPPLAGLTQQLRQGGCVLTFPAGKIEPDPALLPGAAAALEGWSDSIGLFARLAPAAQIVPVLVSGVFSPAALRSPLVRLRRKQAERERFAAMLQVVAPRRYPVRVTVAVGQPLLASDLLARSSPAGVKQAVVAKMRVLLATSSYLI